MLPLAFSVCVRKIGRTGYSISVEISENRLAKVKRNVVLDSPAKYRLIAPAVIASHPLASASAIPPSALTTTTSSGGARQTVSRTKPTSATPKSPGVLTELVQTGL